MTRNSFDEDRLSRVKELLAIQYEKLSEFEKAIELADGPSQRIALRQQLKRNLLPSLREREREYASLLAHNVSVESLPAAEAQELVSDLTVASNRVASYSSDGAPKEVLELLREMKEKLDEPGKSAAAKLKVVLPIVPLIASYELELDTENFVVKIWHKVRNLFERLDREDPR